MSPSLPSPSLASPPFDVIDASDARTVLDEAPSTVELRRRALEVVFDRATGARSTAPPLEDPKAERAGRARACLIGPEWGGIKLPGAQRQNSRRRLLAFVADVWGGRTRGPRCPHARGRDHRGAFRRERLRSTSTGERHAAGRPPLRTRECARCRART